MVSRLAWMLGLLVLLAGTSTAGPVKTDLGSFIDIYGNHMDFSSVEGKKLVEFIFQDKTGTYVEHYSYDRQMWYKFVSMHSEAVNATQRLKPGQRQTFDPMFGVMMMAWNDKKLGPLVTISNYGKYSSMPTLTLNREKMIEFDKWIARLNNLVR